MAYRDPDKRRAQEREASARYRARKRSVGAPEALDGLPEPPDRAECLRILGVQCRNGNTAAIRLLLEEYRRERQENESRDPFGAFDELAQRRAA